MRTHISDGSDAILCEMRSVEVVTCLIPLSKAFQRACVSFFPKASWHCGLSSIEGSTSWALNLCHYRE